MSLKLKMEYLAAIRVRYYNSNKKQKSIILDELCAVTGFNRKYAIRILAIKHIEGKKNSGRKRQYSKDSIKHLQILWVKMGEICSKKIVSALKTWIKYYEAEDFTESIRDEILAMSAATIDRYLKNYKAQLRRKKRSGTKPGKALKNIIPIKDFTTRVEKPGHVEADTVAHCGDSLSGRHIWSLTMTDVYSGWTDNRAIFGKGSDGVLDAIAQIHLRLPYKIVTFNTDNGTEFLNKQLVEYFATESFKDRYGIEFTRSRAYRKNDNCHVEQKNWTHVRELFGHDRYDDEALIEYMNDIYQNYHNVLQNFFVPQLKLVKKERIGSKYKRYYDEPKTPYQRLLESPALTMGQKENLRRHYKQLNPFKLKEELEYNLKRFKRIVRELRYMDEFRRKAA